MLSEEDKAEVREHINEYSKDDIEAKVCIKCVKNKVNFDSDNKAENKETVAKYVSNNNYTLINRNEKTIFLGILRISIA